MSMSHGYKGLPNPIPPELTAARERVFNACRAAGPTLPKRRYNRQRRRYDRRGRHGHIRWPQRRRSSPHRQIPLKPNNARLTQFPAPIPRYPRRRLNPRRLPCPMLPQPQPSQTLAPKQVHMQMPHLLPAVSPLIDNQPIPRLRHPLLLRQLPRRREHPPQQPIRIPPAAR